MENLEIRMFGLVPYNLSPIQQAIQFGHAVVEYGQKAKKSKWLEEKYNLWADNWKTFIILNGGTLGTINRHVLTLLENEVDFATFNEPDLGDQLTAVVFLVDERVFNRKKYPNFEDWVIENYGDLVKTDLHTSPYNLAQQIKNSESKSDKKVYGEWVKLIGGEKNVFLRDFLTNFKLA